MTSVSISADLIAVDWGTSNFRAYLVDENGKVIERRQSDQGILAAEKDGFAAVFERELGAWKTARPDLDVLMSGMIGSRQGWLEAPYAECPVSIADLTTRLAVVPAEDAVRIVPGITYVEGGVPDVMRGEEVQIFGALGRQEADAGVFCLPGTHSKWARVEDGRIRGFATSMTGEVFSILRRHSILERLMEGDGHDERAFDLGLERAPQAGGLLHHLFAARSEGLFGNIPAEAMASYLSGLLIGHEAGAMLARFEPEAGVTLVGDAAICGYYQTALAKAGQETRIVDAETATIQGHLMLRRELNRS